MRDGSVDVAFKKLAARWRETPVRDRSAITQSIYRAYIDLDLSLGDLAKATGISSAALSNDFKRNALAARETTHRTKAALPPQRRYACNEDAFSEPWSTAAAYHFGLLWSDGVPRRGGIALELRAADRDALVNFKQFLESDAPIKKVSYPHLKDGHQLRVEIWSTKIEQALSARNLRPRRSEDNLLPVFPRQFDATLQAHFWRGLLDGDGSIARNRRVEFPLGGWTLGLAGSWPICKLFCEYVAETIGYAVSPHGNGGKPDRNAAVSIQGPAAIVLLRELYRDAHVEISMPDHARVVAALVAALSEAEKAGVRIEERGDGWRFENVRAMPVRVELDLRLAIGTSGHSSRDLWLGR